MPANSKNLRPNPQTFFLRERQPLARTVQDLLNRTENAQVNLNEVNRLARELKVTLERAIADIDGQENAASLKK